MGPESPKVEIAEMPTTKRILCPQRVRSVPKAFSWIDHRLVRDGYISRCSHEALALYLFLVTVADAEGLSYYSDAKASRLLNMDEADLRSARRELCETELIVYRRPLYQVLSLDDAAGMASALRPVESPRAPSEAVSIGEVLRRAMGGEA
jgi:hypothetical protein